MFFLNSNFLKGLTYSAMVNIVNGDYDDDDALSKYCQPTGVREVSVGLFWGGRIGRKNIEDNLTKMFAIYLLSKRQKEGEEDEIHFSNLHFLIKSQKPFMIIIRSCPQTSISPNVLKLSYLQTWFFTYLNLLIFMPWNRHLDPLAHQGMGDVRFSMFTNS